MWFHFVLLSSAKKKYRPGSNPEMAGKGAMVFKSLGREVPYSPSTQIPPAEAGHINKTGQHQRLGDAMGV